MAEKIITLERLAHFKEKQDAANEVKFALKGEIGNVGVATPDKAGIIKPGDAFDVAEDGTLSLYSKIAVNTFTANPSQVERGVTVKDVTLAWSFNKTPKSVTLDKAAQDVASKGATLTGVNLTADKTWTLTATDARDASASRTVSLVFRDSRRWGVGADLAADAVDDAFVNGLTGELATGRAKTFTVNAAAGQYIYYAFPASWGTPRFFVGGFEGGFNLLKTFDHVNASGATVSYVVWKSTNSGLGNTSVEVK
ncbi:hypothetical protein [Bifidobacterium tissieri]|uniref:Uncharacterized protein n=1 Tax=Bifidobacterium tissieri TaxID=1630162 RepID=A0A5M9ZPC3_9BIFI|nr:hypothetical protein [Bifidobacterium tissieri]KAA8829345.1 hypothetical protein EM849_11105 [Bifidobacterium tissieri]KAA8831658.1 hypothetical protein EMO89_02745 [Bifidobacterium tissieri]